MRVMQQHPLIFPLVAAALALPAVAGRARAQDRDAYRIDTTVTVGSGASVDLGLINGDVIVTASSGSAVRVKAYSDVIPLRFEHIGNTVRVLTENGRYRRGGDQRMEVVVPTGTRVSASSISGSVSVRGAHAEVEASSTSGDVTVEDAVRRASATSVSGSVRVRDVDGDVRARSTSGDITVDRVNGLVDLETVSGEVEVHAARSDRVRAQTLSGEVTYEGTISRDGRYDLTSHSGTVRLVVPADAGISLTASTFSGSVNSRLPATLGPTTQTGGVRRGGRMELAINGGGARVTASTFSGDIVIETAERASRRP
ncbi:hypothetical protein J421_4377 [Gemmatirosa kalamazoonensis]|uniref:DUF4097 domain-containing protein n=2 Tax=Gemmatirosa kalamazoonensis TaxID=861299 RepID=W0RLF4_9BACT|nr:hypothetical protein J421_4377 [Gemmatirosa kalamazoonensis]